MEDILTLEFGVNSNSQSNNTDLINSLNNLSTKLNSFETTLGNFVKKNVTANKAANLTDRKKYVEAQTDLQIARTLSKKVDSAVYRSKAKQYDSLYTGKTNYANSQAIYQNSLTKKMQQEAKKIVAQTDLQITKNLAKKLQPNINNSKTRQIKTLYEGKAELENIRVDNNKEKLKLQNSRNRQLKLKQSDPIALNRTEALLNNSKSSLLKQSIISGWDKKSKEAFDRGDNKEGKKYEKMVQNATEKGTRDGIKKSPINKLVGSGALMYTGSLISSQIASNYGFEKNIGSAALNNPLLNNYNYGDQATKILQNSAQEKYSNLATMTTLVGGIVGSIGGVFGATLGSSVGSYIGKVIGASGNMQAGLQAEAIGTYVNQRMTNDALGGSNAAAAGLLYSTKDLNGNRFRTGAGDASSQLDPTMPLAREIAKGAAIYNRNYKEMDTLTKLAIAAQIPMSQLPKLGSMATLLNLSKKDIRYAADLSTNAGVMLPDMLERTLAFQQGGFSKDSAMSAASKSFQNVSGFQNWQTGMLTGKASSRKIATMIGSAFGYDVDAILNPDDPNHAKQYAMFARNSSNKSDLATNIIAELIGGSQSIGNPNNPGGVFLNAGNSKANIDPTFAQLKPLGITKDVSLQAYSGNKVDIEAVSKQMGMLASELSGSVMNLQNFDSALESLTRRVNETFTLNSNNQSAAETNYQIQRKNAYLKSTGSNTSRLTGK